MRQRPAISLQCICLIALSAMGAIARPSASSTEPSVSTTQATLPDPSAALTCLDTQGRPCQPLQVPSGARAVVLVFIAVDCPISNGYAPELRRLMASTNAQQVAFRLVYCDSTQTLPAVRSHLTQFGYSCPAVLDPQHTLARRVGATVTPEVAVFAAGQVVYLGRIDNRWGDFGLQRPSATTHDLADVLASIAQGRPVTTPSTPAVGCPI